MALLEHWGMPLAVAGLLLATLCLAGLLGRYQSHRRRIRGIARRIEASCRAISRALEALRGVPLSRELRVMLRTEVCVGYQQLRRYYRRVPALDDSARAAQKALDAEGPTAPDGVGPIEDEQARCRLLCALDDLDRLIAAGTLARPLPRDVAAVFRRELGERRAEVVARYYLVASRRLREQGRTARARAQLATLMRILRERGPATGFVRALHQEAAAAAAALDRDEPVGRAVDGPQRGGRTGATPPLRI